MKIFVPMTDKLVNDKGVVTGNLVPFNPAFLQGGKFKAERSVKPANWISDCDYAAARARLFGESARAI